MYGTLDAASIWQETYSRVLSDLGIEQSVAWPTLFVHRGRDLKFLVHGDDFVALGSDELKFLEEVLGKHFEYRMDGKMGPDATDGVAMTVLNRALHVLVQDGK